jgi:hypothetical protein
MGVASNTGAATSEPGSIQRTKENGIFRKSLNVTIDQLAIISTLAGDRAARARLTAVNSKVASDL